MHIIGAYLICRTLLVQNNLAYTNGLPNCLKRCKQYRKKTATAIAITMMKCKKVLLLCEGVIRFAIFDKVQPALRPAA